MTFRFPPPVPAQRVSVAGSFNDWRADAAVMADGDGDGVYEITLRLRPGRHLYKFVVRTAGGDHWFPDPSAPVWAPDGYGSRNSVVVVAAGVLLVVVVVAVVVVVVVVIVDVVVVVVFVVFDVLVVAFIVVLCGDVGTAGCGEGVCGCGGHCGGGCDGSVVRSLCSSER